MMTAQHSAEERSEFMRIILEKSPQNGQTPIG